MGALCVLYGVEDGNDCFFYYFSIPKHAERQWTEPLAITLLSRLPQYDLKAIEKLPVRQYHDS